MDDLNNIIAKLHPLERQVLPVLKETSNVFSICKKTKLADVEVMRALQWLENKEILTTKTEKKKIIILEKNGILYKKEGLPEKRFLKALDETFKGLNVIIKKARLSKEEANACIGLLKKKNLIEISQDNGLTVKITENGKNIVHKEWPEEQFLLHAFPKEYDESTDKNNVEELKKRREIISVQEEKNVTATLTPLGFKIAQQDLGGEVINRLTPGMLRSGTWKEKTFRAYDVEINVPKKYGGREHWVTQTTGYEKKIWMDMGFQEMRGDMVQTSFWNFDALFTPQDHPVREMQDTYFIGGEAEKGKLPPPDMVKKIQQVHENGGKTGSTGWQYKWDEEEAKRNVLRTHTTVLTAQKLAQLKEKDLPIKLFALGKNFRNEALDWNHLNEFNQTEGIVVDANVNFRDLLGYLKEFFTKMGFPQARFRAAFFPYTSPSVEIDVYHPIRQRWIEFGGAGMLRPEVVVPLLGKDIPVLAWGPGFDRIILDYWNITDIRDLYKNDLKRLRESRLFLK